MNALIIAAVMLGATSQPATQPTTRPAKVLPATYIEENAEKLGPEAVAWLKQVKWGKISPGDTEVDRWGCGACLFSNLPGRRAPKGTVEIVVTCLGLVDGKPTKTVQVRQYGLSSPSDILLCGKIGPTFLSLSPAPAPANLHVAVLYKGIRVYECLLLYDATAQLESNGLPWWQDASIRVPAVPR
jgi:hypothetical protein